MAGADDVTAINEPPPGLFDVSLVVNGVPRRARVPARRLLSDFLRHDLRLTGTHVGCEHGVCGACTVLVDGVAARSCLMLAVTADGARVTTVEGLAGPDGTLSPVQQAFAGEFSGRALLIFPETNSLELVRAVTGGELPLEDIIDLEQEALAETGNIILNGCLAAIANILQRSLNVSLPEIVRGTGTELFELSGASESDDVVLLLYIDFSVNERDIRGYIALLMGLSSVAALRELLRDLIRRTIGEIPPVAYVAT
jgi:chemotaxis protein CheC